MPAPDLLLEFLIVALDAPAQLGNIDQLAERNVFRKVRQPIFGRLLLAFGPLDQQPLFRSALAALEVTPRNANTHTSKARGQALGGALAPFDRAPSALGQTEREFLDRDRLMLGVTLQELWWSAAARPLFW